MGGGKGGTRKIYDFLYSVDLGLCHGPLDSINEVLIKDKSAFVGPVAQSGQVLVNKPDLFGGDDKEGGVVGVMEFYMGDYDQLASPNLAARFDRASSDTPGYKGLAHIFFRGEQEYSEGSESVANSFGGTLMAWLWETVSTAAIYTGSRFGFRWGSNNPYFPSTHVRVTRAAQGLVHPPDVYPIVGIENPEGTPAPPFITRWPDLNSTAKSQEGLNPVDWHKLLPDYDTPRFFAYAFPSSNFNNLSLHPEFGDQTYNHNTASAELVVDVDISDLPAGTEISYSHVFRIITGNGISQVLGTNEIFYMRSYTTSEINNVSNGELAGGSPGTNRATVSTSHDVDQGQSVNIDRSFSYTKQADDAMLRFNYHIDGVFYVLGVYKAMVISNPTLEYENPVDYLPPSYEIAAPGDAYATGELDPTKLPDANPASMIYETLTNADWGLGESPAAIDKQSFEDAAETLSAEHFGLSMMYTDQDTARNFVQEILDHIKGFLRIDRRTGLRNLKLARGDYDVAELPVLDESNATLRAHSTQLWAETINEIVVQYTDPENEELEPVSRKNESNVAIQGGVVSETRTYYGVRNPYLARKLAERDLAEASRPTSGATVSADRSFNEVLIGDVVLLNFPNEGINNLPMRVIKANYGTDQKRDIVFELVEDIFSGDAQADVFDVPVIGSDEEDVPEVLDTHLLMTPPLPVMIQGGLDVDEFDAEYPKTFVSFLAADADYDPIDIQAWSDTFLPNGAAAVASVAEFGASENAALPVDLVPEVRSVLPGGTIVALFRGAETVGSVLVIGDSENNHELVMLDSYNAVDHEWTVLRGLYDTQPLSWSSGTRLWRFSSDPGLVDLTDRVPGVAVTYRLLPRTRTGRLAYDDAPDVVVTPSERVYAPFRPANVQIDGGGFGVAVFAGVLPAQIDVTWATRNRKFEDVSAEAWDAAAVLGETGQTVSLRVVDSATETEVHSAAGLTGNIYSFDPSALTGGPRYRLEVWSVRDGVDSLSVVSRDFEIPPGYGENYGNYYGP